jgi:hypothetical protein
MFLERLGKTTKGLRIAGNSAEIRIRTPPKYKSRKSSLDQPAQYEYDDHDHDQDGDDKYMCQQFMLIGALDMHLFYDVINVI